MNITEQKKREWLQKTGDPAALELLAKNLNKSANETNGLLFKEENVMNEETKQELETNANVVTDDKVEKDATEEVVVNSEEVSETETKEEAIEVKEEIQLQKAEEFVVMVEPLVEAIEKLVKQNEQLIERVAKLEKAATVEPVSTNSFLLPSAATASLLKERLSKVPTNTFLVEADEKLVKQKPKENTVVMDETKPTGFDGFLSGI